MAYPIQLYAALVDVNGNAISALSPIIPPGGRLTLTTATPVLSGAVATSANVLYTPYVSNYIPTWNGSQWVPTIFTELTNVLANSSVGNAGPAAGAASKNYDLFVWNSSGTLYLTRGGAWNSDTARSATTENDLQRVQGILCNLNAITNGPAAGYGLYVGTVRTDASGATVSWAFGGAGAGGVAATINVWNMYNRVEVTTISRDTGATWTYSSATIRAANASNAHRASFVRGLNEEGVVAQYEHYITTAAALGALTYAIIGLDATNAQAASSVRGLIKAPTAAAFEGSSVARYTDLPGLGFHFLQACEGGDGTNTNTINANSIFQAFTSLMRA